LGLAQFGVQNFFSDLKGHSKPSDLSDFGLAVNPEFIPSQELIYVGHTTLPVGGLILPSIGTILYQPIVRRLLHLMRKGGINLEDNPLGDGSRTKRLGRKDFDALMGADGRSGIFTQREKNNRQARTIVLVFAEFSHRSHSMHLLISVPDSAVPRPVAD